MLTKWLFLAGAIVSEVTGSLSLKAALDQPGFYALVATGYIASFAFLAAVLKAGIPLGVAYGIWGAIGVALTAVLGAAIYDEPLNTAVFVGIALIIGGVLIVELGSQKAKEANG